MISSGVIAESSVVFFKKKTANEMRISEWIQTCTLPISLAGSSLERWGQNSLSAAVGRGQWRWGNPKKGARPRRVCRRHPHHIHRLPFLLAVHHLAKVAREAERLR